MGTLFWDDRWIFFYTGLFVVGSSLVLGCPLVVVCFGVVGLFHCGSCLSTGVWDFLQICGVLIDLWCRFLGKERVH